MSAIRFIATVTFACLLTAGCASRESTDTAEESRPAKSEAKKSKKSILVAEKTEAKSERRPAFKLGGLGIGGSTPKVTEKKAPVETTESVKAALRPLQIIVGKWNALSNRPPKQGFKGNNVFQWQWDYTKKGQPALKMTSDETNPHVNTARLSFSVADQKFTLDTVDKDGNERNFLGEFTMDVVDVPSDDDPDRTERMYKLEFNETSPADESDKWQIVFNQVENNDFRLEFAKFRGDRANRFDTVKNQRDGTSFAKRADDYGDRTCVVSQGLGTETVKDPESGKTYWVCCSGCKAAFEDDPAYWIAKFEKYMEEKKK